MSAAGSVPELDALLDELSEDAGERERMSRALRLLAYAPEPVAPPGGLRERILARISEEPRAPTFEVGNDYFARAAEMEWTELAPGIEVKVLFRDAATRARTTLVRMGPNLAFPPHEHDVIEDLYLVSGEAWVGEVRMDAGDYCRAPAGTEHRDVRSGAAGALSMVISR
ncbi:MAG: cupin domain-containing protein [Dehalococcoidia bacterium]